MHTRLAISWCLNNYQQHMAASSLLETPTVRSTRRCVGGDDDQSVFLPLFGNKPIQITNLLSTTMSDDEFHPGHLNPPQRRFQFELAQQRKPQRSCDVCRQRKVRCEKARI